jgi:hypothetical protein
LNARPDVCGTLYGLLIILKGSGRQNPGFNLIFVLSFPFELSTLNFELLFTAWFKDVGLAFGQTACNPGFFSPPV